MDMVMGIMQLVHKYKNLPMKMSHLKRKFDALERREEGIITELEYAESLLMKKRKFSVENWLARVAKVKTEVHDLEQRVQQGGILNHVKLPGMIDELEVEVTELSQHVFLEGLTFEMHDNQGLELPTSELVGRKFQKRKTVIHESLRDADIFSIGIYGMAGIGKTTLIMHIHNELLNDSNTRVYWVTVSQNFTIHKLQSDIAKALSVDLRNEDDERKRAAIIMRFLKGTNNFVLILDDLWDMFPLECAGIPTGGRCKLIFTTRSLEVCNQMACDFKIELLPLTIDEGWMLFTKTLGSGTTLCPQIEEVAKSLSRECAGLPLAIIAMAGSMRGVDDIREWQYALETMRSQLIEIRDDPQVEKVFQVLRFSYDALKDPVVKECLLYCTLFPEDSEIRRDDLIKYFVNEGLIRGMGSREAEFNRGHHILSRLVKVCLLQGGSNKKYVKMHDVVRDMALRIANDRERRFLVKAGLMFVDVADEENWLSSLERVSFMESYLLDTLSSASPPRCPRLSTLLLRDCYNLTSIPNSFFVNMTSLTTLDMSHTGITCLPISISYLTSLKALLLGCCHALVHVAPLSNLKDLKRLDLSCTGIKELPQGMDRLFNLRYLNLDGAKSLQMIPEGIFSKLSCLRCLALPKLAIGKAVVEEIASLRKLERFKGGFYNTNGLDTLLKSWKEGRPYEYIIGPYDRVFSQDSLKLTGLEKYLSIRNCHDLGMLCELTSLRNLSDLRTCCVGESHRMKHLFCRGCYNHAFAQSLEFVCLESLLNLHDLMWEESCSLSSFSSSSASTSTSTSTSTTSTLQFRTSETFSSLKVFRICKCPVIKKLFMPPLVSHLRNLETLTICDCDKLLEIVQGPSDHGDQDHEASTSGCANLFSILPNLKSLELLRLPELKSFCQNTKMVSYSLEEVSIVDCPKLETVPFLGEEPYLLASESMTTSAISFPRIAEAGTFSTVKGLTIKGCHKLKKLFTLAITSRLENLEKLFVIDCEELVEIVHIYEDIDRDADEPKTSSSFTFCALPKLKVLKMELLPELKSFCRSRKVVSDLIEKISIINCPMLHGFPLVREEPNPLELLKSITVEDEWWEAMEFEHPNTKDVLRPVCDFRRRFVRPCHRQLITSGEVLN